MAIYLRSPSQAQSATLHPDCLLSPATVGTPLEAREWGLELGPDLCLCRGIRGAQTREVPDLEMAARREPQSPARYPNRPFYWVPLPPNWSDQQNRSSPSQGHHGKGIRLYLGSQRIYPHPRTEQESRHEPG